MSAHTSIWTPSRYHCPTCRSRYDAMYDLTGEPCRGEGCSGTLVKGEPPTAPSAATERA